MDEMYIYSKGKPVDERLLELHEKTEDLFRESLDYPWFVPVNIGTSTIDAAIFTQNAQLTVTLCRWMWWFGNADIFATS